MSRTEYITDLIDDAIRSGITYSKDKKFWGIVQFMECEGQVVPVSFKGHGDGEIAGWDDVNTFNIYHRITGESETPDSTQGFGTNLLVTQNVNIRLVIYGDSSKVGDFGKDVSLKLKDDIASLIPKSFTSAQLTAIDAQSAFIQTGNKSTDRRAIFNEEMPNAQRELSYKDFAISIDYSINIVFQSSCRTNETICES